MHMLGVKTGRKADKGAICQGVTIQIPKGLASRVDELTANRLDQRLTCRSVPLRGGVRTGVGARPALKDHAELK